MPSFQVSRKFISCLLFILTMVSSSLTEQSRTQNIGNSQSLTGNHFEPPKFENVFEAHLAGLRPGLRRAGVHTGGLEPLKNEADWPVIIKRNLMEQTRPEEAVVASGDKDCNRKREEETLVLRTRSAVMDRETALELDKSKIPTKLEQGSFKGRADGRVGIEQAALLSERRQNAQESAFGVNLVDSLTAAPPMEALFAPQQIENGLPVSFSDTQSTLIEQFSTPLNWTASITGVSSVATMDSTAPATVQPQIDGAASTFSTVGLPTSSVPSVTLSSPGLMGPLSESVGAVEIPSCGGALDMAEEPVSEGATENEGFGGPLNMASSTEYFPLFSNNTERLTSESSRIPSLSPESTRYSSEEESGSRLILAKKGRQAFGIMSKGQFLVNDRDTNTKVRKFRNKGDSSRMDSNDEEMPKDRDQLWENTDLNLEFEDSRGNKPLVDELREDKATEMITSQNNPARGEETNSKFDPSNNVGHFLTSRHFELDPSEGPIQLTLDPRNGSLTIKTEDMGESNSTGMQVSMSIGGKKTGIIRASLPNSVSDHPDSRGMEQRKVSDVDISRKLVDDAQTSFDIKHKKDNTDDALQVQKDVTKKNIYFANGGHRGITKLSDDVLEEKPYSQNMMSLALNKGKGEWMDAIGSQQKSRIEPELQGRKNDGIREMWSDDPVAEVEVNSPTKEGVRIIAPGGQTTVQVKAPESDDVRKYTSIPSSRAGDDGEEKRIDVLPIDSGFEKGQSPDEHTLVVDGIVIKVSGSGHGTLDERPLKRGGGASNVNIKSFGDTVNHPRLPPRPRDNEPGQKSRKSKEDQVNERRENQGNKREKSNASNNASNLKRPGKGSKKYSHNTSRNEERKKSSSNSDDSKVGRDDTNDQAETDESFRWEDNRSTKRGTDTRLSYQKEKDQPPEREFKVANDKSEDVRRGTGAKKRSENSSSENVKLDIKTLKNPRIDLYESQNNGGLFTGPDTVTLAFKQDVRPGDIVEPVNVPDGSQNSPESISPPQGNINKPSDTREAAMRLLMKSRGDKDTLAERTKNLLLKLQPSLASNVPGNLDVVEKGLHALKSASGDREYHPVNSALNNDKTIREKQRIFYHRQDIENLVKRADSQDEHEVHVSKTHNSQGLGQNVKPQIKEVSQEDSDVLFRENPLDMMEKKGTASRKIRAVADETPIKKRLMNRPGRVPEERRLKQRSPIGLSEEERDDWEGVDLNTGTNNYYAERAFPAIVNPEDSFVNTEANILGAPFQRQRSEMDAAQLESEDVAVEENPPLFHPHVSAVVRDTKRDAYMESFERQRKLISSDNTGSFDSFLGATQVALEAPAQRQLEARQAAVLPLPLPFFSVVTMAAAPLPTADISAGETMLPTDHKVIFTMGSSLQTPQGQPVPAPLPASVPPLALVPALPSTPLATQLSVFESVQPSVWTKLSPTPTSMVQAHQQQFQPPPEQQLQVQQQQQQSLLPPVQAAPPLPSLIPPSPPPSATCGASPAALPAAQPTLVQANGVVMSAGQPSLPSQHEEHKADEPRPPPRPLPPPRPVPPNFAFSPSTPLASTQVSYTPSLSTCPSRLPPSSEINKSRGLAKHTTMDMLPAAAAAVSAAVSLVGLGGAEESPSRGRLTASAPPLQGVKKERPLMSDEEERRTSENKSSSTPSDEAWHRLNAMLQNEMKTGDLDGNPSKDTERNKGMSPVPTPDEESATLQELIKIVSNVSNNAIGSRLEKRKRERGGDASGGGGGAAARDFGNDNNFLNSWRKIGSGGDNTGGGGKGRRRIVGRHRTDKRSTMEHTMLISGISPSSVYPDEKPLPFSSTDTDYFDDLGTVDSSRMHHMLSHGSLKNESSPADSLVVAAAAGKKSELEDATPTRTGEEKRRLHGGGGLTAERSLSARLGKIWHAAHFHHPSSTASELLRDSTNKDTDSSSMTLSFSDSSTDRMATMSSDHWSADSSPAPTQTAETTASISSTGAPWEGDESDLSEVHGRLGRHRDGASPAHALSKVPRQATMAVTRRKMIESGRSTDAFGT